MIPPRAPPKSKHRIHAADLAVICATVLVLLIALWNVLANMAAAGIRPGFGFLLQNAGFDVSEALIPYGASDSYGRVIVAGVLNTLFLAAVCLVLSTMIGVALGLISVGPSPIGRALVHATVEVFRNLPKLLVLLVLYVLAVNGLPPVREAISIGPFHLSNRSLNVPTVVSDATMAIPIVVLCVGIMLWWRWQRHIPAIRPQAGRQGSIVILLISAFLAALSVFVFAVPITLSLPELTGFDFQGGGRVSLQFAVIAVTLGVYHGAQIAEVIRGGLSAIPKGQSEAALSLGLSRWQATRLIILPQVLRIVVPPMNNQYVNLIKNTSIAIAVGYSDLMSVSGTIINQTFRPLEMMMITMGVYLAICLFVTTMLNRFHRHLTAREAR